MRQGVALCLGMLRGGFAWANVALLAAALGCGILQGTVGAVNAAVAGAVVLLFAATGQAVQMVATDMADSNGMLLVVASYLGRVVAMGALLWVAMAHSGSIEPVLDRMSVMAGSLATLVGWIGGVIWTHAHQQVSVYDSQWERARAQREADGGSK